MVKYIIRVLCLGNVAIILAILLVCNTYTGLSIKTLDDGCSDKFYDTVEENLKVIENYPGGTADRYMWKIGGNLTQPIKRQNYPVLVTALSSQYIPLLPRLLYSYHYNAARRQKGDKIDFIIYDIGMTPTERKSLKDSGMPFEIREFPFDEFPPHVKTIKYMAWKPILMQIMLMEFGFVWWVDTSVRFKTFDADNVFEEAKQYGLVFNYSPKDKLHNLTKHTDIKTFKYLGEDTCKFRQLSEPDGRSIIVYFNSISKIIIRAWARCALDKNCIAPDETIHNCDARTINARKCHRLDKSVLGILTRRIYHEQDLYSFMEVSNDITRVNISDVCKSDFCEF